MNFMVKKIIVIQFKIEQKIRNSYVENLPENLSLCILKTLQRDHVW
jgi:hypothetical protein